MLLSADSIRRACLSDDEWPLVTFHENKEKKLRYIEGSAIDFTVKDVYRVQNDAEAGLIGVNDRYTPVAASMEAFPPGHHRNRIELRSIEHEFPKERWKSLGHVWSLPFTSFVKLQLNEELVVPKTLLGIVKPRRTFFENSCILSVTDIAPGYHGFLVIGLLVMLRGGLLLEKNAACAAVRFAEFDSGNTDPYLGKLWKGDQIGTDGVKPGIGY
jgi:deoxycytidine triphosphate deaminase